MAKTINKGYITAKINGINVNSSIKASSKNYNSRTSRSVSYVVMHYTGNPKDTAKANCNYFASGSRSASAHFFVDDATIYQSVELRDIAWHCGGKQYFHSVCRNSNSFGIEMCCTAGNYKISDKTIKNAAYLCAYLCEMLGIGADEVDKYVLRHYDITHKKCPAQMANSENDTDWENFKKQVKNILAANNSSATVALPYKVKITASVLNVRAGAGTSYKVTTTVKKDEVYTIVAVSGGWGKLKSGAGWISLAYTKQV